MKVTKKNYFFLLLVFILLSCGVQSENLKQKWQDIKETFSENFKVFLTNFPVIKNYIKLSPPPKELYEEMQLTLSQLEAYKANELYPEEYGKIADDWKEIKKLYQERYYLKAQKLLKKTLPSAKALLEKVRKYHSDLKKSAWDKYKEVEGLAQGKIKKGSPEERLKVQLYLWKLKNLITLEKYEEFRRELEKRPF